MTTEAKPLSELQAAGIKRMDWKDGFKATRPLPESDESALHEYFRQFVNPHGKCICCETELSGLLGSFQWGFVHGEGACSQCGYPARAYHRNVGPIEFLQVILQYHPDELRLENKEAGAA